MKRKLVFTSILVMVLFLAASTAVASLAGYSLPWWTVDSGGGDSTGGTYILNGTIGQPDAGALSNGNYRLEGGFWGGVVSGTPQPDAHSIYLPLTTKP